VKKYWEKINYTAYTRWLYSRNYRK